MFRDLFVCCWRDSPQWAKASSFTRFLDHTQRRTSRQETSRRVIYSSQRPLPGNTQHSQQTPMPPVGFEPTISAGERPQTYVLDRAATGTGKFRDYYTIITTSSSSVLNGLTNYEAHILYKVTLDLPHITSKFRTVTMFVTADIQTIFHTFWRFTAYVWSISYPKLTSLASEGFISFHDQTKC